MSSAAIRRGGPCGADRQVGAAEAEASLGRPRWLAKPAVTTASHPCAAKPSSVEPLHPRRTALIEVVLVNPASRRHSRHLVLNSTFPVLIRKFPFEYSVGRASTWLPLYFSTCLINAPPGTVKSIRAIATQ